MKPAIKIKRAYDEPLEKDGYRVLVDRLWPRGLKKENAALDEWAKDLAPSTQLRKWFGHDPALWTEFQQRYLMELKNNKEVDSFAETHKSKKIITLIYSAKDAEHNNAVVLQRYLETKFHSLNK